MFPGLYDLFTTSCKTHISSASVADISLKSCTEQGYDDTYYDNYLQYIGNGNGTFLHEAIHIIQNAFYFLDAVDPNRIMFMKPI